MYSSKKTSTYNNSEFQPLVKKSGTKYQDLQSKRCSNFLFNVLPILHWLPHYNLKLLQYDAIAGLSVGLTVVPQSLAYARIAGLPLQYGLYTSLMGGFVYCILGTSKDLTLGPAAIMSLFVQTYGKGNVVQVVILTLLGGCMQFVMGALRLGFVMRYLSLPVVSGFTSAVAIIVGFGQVKHLLGIKIERQKYFIPEMKETFKNIGSTNIWDLIMGLSCLVILFLLRFINNNIKHYPTESKLQKYAKIFLWFVSTGKNAIIVLCSAAVAYAIHTQHVNGCKIPDCVTLTGKIVQGLPPFKPPAFTETKGNVTVSVGEFVQNLGAGLIIVPMMGFLESIAIEKAFARKDGYEVNVNQEMIAIGIANIIGSFVSAYTMTGSFSRSAINNQCKVKTPLSGIFTGLMVILSLCFLTPMFYFIPLSSLAAVIIIAVMSMIDITTVRQLWNAKKIDLFPLVATFLVCFWYIPYGIIAGIFINLLILLYPISFPEITFTSFPIVCGNDGKELLIVNIQSGITYPCVEYICNQLKQKLRSTNVHFSAVLLDFKHIVNIDFTAAQTIFETAADFKKIATNLCIMSSKDSVKDCLASMAQPGILNFCNDVTEAVSNIEKYEEC